MKKISRRKFAKNSVQAAAALAGLGACTSLPLSSRSISSEKEFDFIVIGSGAGGGVVAANLAKAKKRVLLLEAGGNAESNRHTTIPGFHAMSTEVKEVAWNFYVRHYSNSSRQKRDSKFNASAEGVLYPRAATLGGCTTHHAMITLYPDNQDWDGIAQVLAGSPSSESWKSNNMRRYFQQIEKNNYIKKTSDNDTKNGFDGWLSTEQGDPTLAFKDPSLRKILLSSLFGAKPSLDQFITNPQMDPNRWQYVKNKHEGAFNIPKSTLNGKRVGTRDLLLKTQREFSDYLTIKTNCFVTKLIFDPNDPKRIDGVEFAEGSALYGADPRPRNSAGALQFVRAGKEVILAGGVFNSPQTLMLSGIGDPDWIKNPRIPLKGVGKNLQDRYEVGVVSKLNSPIPLIERCSFDNGFDPCLQEYDQNPNVSVYANNGVAISFFKKSNTQRATPDLDVFGIPGDFRGYFDGWARTSYKPDHFTWAILKGFTRNTAGTVKLKDLSPFSTPDIEFKYFDEGSAGWNDDLEAMLQGVKLARRLNKNINANPFDHFTSEEVWPGPNYSTDSQVKTFIQNEAWGHHASCTNKIGPQNDEMAVVDGKFMVHGTKNLRIVDASVFPKIPGLFIVLPILMIAEKASEDILRAHV